MPRNPGEPRRKVPKLTSERDMGHNVPELTSEEKEDESKLDPRTMLMLAHRYSGSSSTSSFLSAPIPEVYTRFSSALWNPFNFTETRNFSAKVTVDKSSPDIKDVKLLPKGLIVMADSANRCVKLFTTRGRHIASHQFEKSPTNLAVLDADAEHTWDVAVSSLGIAQVSLLQVTPTGIKHMSDVGIKGACKAITAMDKNTLVVGYHHLKGIDKINIAGKLELQLNLTMKPSSLSASSDGSEVMGTCGSEVFKLRTRYGHEVYKKGGWLAI
ncbi:hypothetical protein ElyMa_001963000 [Elysia marginata]|uniref:Uncharacterized protein n=1 Tax=Elysia marginata TaxID=1093978 RepID=A0AAV4EYF3_9GAST|nr:hypothetical protein ElyMa_001963000 [Elysia marginata]